jgi:hypothetical protein
MAKLAETIERLVTTLASDIIAAIKDVPLNELMALGVRPSVRGASGAPPAAAPETSAPRRGRGAKARSNGAKRKAKAPPPPARPDPKMIDAIVGYLTERGKSGATPHQVHEHLKASGFEPTGVNDVVVGLAERGIVRDAGFRRTTGKGTAPVFVLASLS